MKVLFKKYWYVFAMLLLVGGVIALWFGILPKAESTPKKELDVQTLKEESTSIEQTVDGDQEAPIEEEEVQEDKEIKPKIEADQEENKEEEREEPKEQLPPEKPEGNTPKEEPKENVPKEEPKDESSSIQRDPLPEGITVSGFYADIIRAATQSELDEHAAKFGKDLTYCSQCGRPTVAKNCYGYVSTGYGLYGTCTQYWAHSGDCECCGEFISVNTCHNCF